MHAIKTTVFVIDDDESVQRALSRLLSVAEFHVITFSSVDQFLSTQEWPNAACVIADVRMPGIVSMELPELLASKGLHYPVIILTAQDTRENRTAANQAGVAAFFRKPVDDQALVDSIVWAMRDTSHYAGLNH